MCRGSQVAGRFNLSSKQNADVQGRKWSSVLEEPDEAVSQLKGTD